MRFFSIQKNHTTNRQAGFTLVETLVAVAIFSVSISAVISVVANGVASTSTTKNRITANYLAQENIEYVRHLRNKYTPSVGVAETWNDFLLVMNACTNKLCVIADPALSDPTPEMFTCLDQTAGGDFPVVVDSHGYFFQEQFSLEPHTLFSRYVTAEIDQANTNIMKVTSTVVWKEKNNVPKNVTLTETLTNWLPN